MILAKIVSSTNQSKSIFHRMKLTFNRGYCSCMINMWNMENKRL